MYVAILSYCISFDFNYYVGQYYTMLSYGESAGDQTLSKMARSSPPLTQNGYSFTFYGSNEDTIFVGQIKAILYKLYVFFFAQRLTYFSVVLHAPRRAHL